MEELHVVLEVRDNRRWQLWQVHLLAAEFRAPGGTTGDYVKIQDAGACCEGGKSNGEVGKVADGNAPSPEACEDACDANAQCMMFSHANEWKNCVLCSRCTFTTVGNAAKYASWGVTVARRVSQDTVAV